jgi:hypothetical protein
MNAVYGVLTLAGLYGLFMFLSWQAPGVAITRGAPLVQIPAPVLAERYLAWAQRELPECYGALDGPQAHLARAIIAVEAASRGPMESLFEGPVFRLASLVLRNPPDWSVGPAQLRYATLSRIPEVGQAGATALTDDCANMNGALAVVRALYRENVGSEGDRRTAVIRAYNGQRTSNVSNAAYVAVVLAVYEALASPAAERGKTARTQLPDAEPAMPRSVSPAMAPETLHLGSRG